jgi:diadenylate cyclase
MAETRTGALIIIERQTRLGELIEQENVVQLDAAVSATMLMQIFYKGSPLHDGAVLIRDGRLTAARVHVPLSDNYHLRKDFGTRHRAAIGASEMGDAIAVVVSEERGCISLTLEGRLYTLDNADALRTLLHKLLSPSRPGVSLGNLGSLFRGGRRVNRQNPQNCQTDDSTVPANGQEEITGAADDEQGIVRIIERRRKLRPSGRMIGKNRVLLLIASLAIAVVLWLYVQVTINPVDTRSFVVPLSYRGVEIAESKGFELQIPLQSIQITLQGRKKTIAELSTDDIEAYLDFSEIKAVGLVKMEVRIGTSGLLYIAPSYISPAEITVSITMGRLFGTDGVRGIANKELTPDLAFHLGFAGANVLAGEGSHKPLHSGRPPTPASPAACLNPPSFPASARPVPMPSSAVSSRRPPYRLPVAQIPVRCRRRDLRVAQFVRVQRHQVLRRQWLQAA